MSLATPTKAKKAINTSDDPFVDDRQLSTSPTSTKEETETDVEEQETSLDQLRTRYVGDVDLPEGSLKFFFSSCRSP